VQTPFVQLAVPSEPTSAVSAKALGAALVTTLPFASLIVTVTLAVPFTATELGETESVDVPAFAAPNVVVMFDVVPVRLPASVPVTVCTVAATALVVNVTVA